MAKENLSKAEMEKFISIDNRIGNDRNQSDRHVKFEDNSHLFLKLRGKKFLLIQVFSNTSFSCTKNIRIFGTHLFAMCML